MSNEAMTKDIKAMEQALKLIEKTECYTLFRKSHLIFEICEQINVLREKQEKQQKFLANL